MKYKVGLFIMLILFGSINDGFSQNIITGPYYVGFNYLKLHDESRKYVINNDTTSRPLLMHFWCPSEENNEDSCLSFKNYIDLISLREDFGKHSGEIDQNSINFINAYAKFAKHNLGVDTNLTTQQILDCPVIAQDGVEIASSTKKLPLIIYAPSNSKSSVQNHMICEYLASHGYMVISVGSAGANSLSRKNDQESIIAQVEDMEYILKYFKDNLNLKYSGLGLFGFSTGGLATTIFQMRNKEVRAVFSMDGSQEYGHYPVLSKVDDFNLKKTNVPYCLIVNNYENFSIYPFYNSMLSTEKYMFRMPYLDHNGFVSYWRYFDLCSSNSNVSQFCSSYDYICITALAFFDSYLKTSGKAGTQTGLNSIENEFVRPVNINNSMIAQLGNLLLSANNDAVTDFLVSNKEALRTKENEINVLSNLFIDGDAEATLQLLLFNLKMHPDSWETLLKLGNAYKVVGEPDLAMESLQKAQQLVPGNPDVIKLMEEFKNAD